MPTSPELVMVNNSVPPSLFKRRVLLEPPLNSNWSLSADALNKSARTVDESKLTISELVTFIASEPLPAMVKRPLCRWSFESGSVVPIPTKPFPSSP